MTAMTQSEHDCSVQFEIDESERGTIQTTLDSRLVNTKRNSVKVVIFEIGTESKKTNDKTVGGSTVCGYVNAIVDLYNEQVTLRTNSNPHPRTTSVKQPIKNVQAQSTATRKRNYEDRGIGSLLDGVAKRDP
ncbi:hypothetical protein PHMEG_0008638 [Phytophthora megakarya]|uniref:Uncharacterized protein n=1 Tax=Phytophthora megakarya TaxID=4795 RepID=A0A225WIM9_9STRA|nr:hypothetical protein PHMEG_0008638 [Phytophthora megakarya]